MASNFSHKARSLRLFLRHGVFHVLRFFPLFSPFTADRGKPETYFKNPAPGLDPVLQFKHILTRESEI